jgi:cell division protein FtsQ
LRSGNLFSNRDSSVLDAPQPDRASVAGKAEERKRGQGAAVTEMPLRRDAPYSNNFADEHADGFDPDGEFSRRGRRPGVRLSFTLPRSRWARIATGAGFLLLAAAGVAGALWVRSFLLHDEHFLVPGSESIQIAGNSHLTRPQLLSVFGEDVDRNIFTIPLAERRAELESLPWVAHATVMRLLPNRVRVAIVERTPVAFVRQGSQIGLVDLNGVLFDLPEANEETGGKDMAEYSFPVLTGISAGDPLSTRAARMRIYMGFVAALDAGGEGISHRLSEVDLSNPDDVKAMIPDSGGAGPEMLVHFGEDKFLERYRQYEAHLAEWRAQYPKLASVDMRYERQVVLEMQPGTASTSASGASGQATGGAKAQPAKAKVAANHPAPAAKLPSAAKPGVAAAKTAAGQSSAAGATTQEAPR